MSLCFFLHDLYCLRDDPSLSTVPHRWTKKWVKQKTLMFSFYSYCGWYRVQFYFYGIEEALNGGLFSVLLTTIPGDIWSFEKTTLRIWLFCLLAILRKRRLFFQKLCCFMAWLFVGYGKEHIIGKRVHKSAICDTITPGLTPWANYLSVPLQCVRGSSTSFKSLLFLVFFMDSTQNSCGLDFTTRHVEFKLQVRAKN